MMKSFVPIMLVSGMSFASATAYAQRPNKTGASQQDTTGEQPQQLPAVTQDRLKKNLEDAGFTNVQIVNASYLVQAQTVQGNTVLMLVDPPARVPSIGAPGQSGSTGTQSGTSE